MANDLKRIQQERVKQLREWGWHVDDKGKHYHVIDPRDGRHLATIAKTPSDHRTPMNDLAVMKRVGVWQDIRERKERPVAQKVKIPPIVRERIVRVADQLGYQHGARGPGNPTLVELVRHGNELAKKDGAKWIPPTDHAGTDLLRRIYTGASTSVMDSSFEWVMRLLNDVDRGGTIPPKPVSNGKVKKSSFRCSNCGETFARYEELHSHTVAEHSEMTTPVAASANGPSPDKATVVTQLVAEDTYPLDVRVLAAILDPTVTRAEAVEIALEVRHFIRATQ